jgi:hypothetical protein
MSNVLNSIFTINIDGNHHWQIIWHFIRNPNNASKLKYKSKIHIVYDTTITRITAIYWIPTGMDRNSITNHKLLKFRHLHSHLREDENCWLLPHFSQLLFAFVSICPSGRKWGPSWTALDIGKSSLECRWNQNLTFSYTLMVPFLFFASVAAYVIHD